MFTVTKQNTVKFVKLGLKANQCVAIIGFNAPEWMIALYGTIFSGFLRFAIIFSLTSS
jgi:hypothetical protein